MTRREFPIVIAGSTVLPASVFGAPSQVLLLHAIAGAHLPQTLAITTTSHDELRRGIWELRTYRAAAPVLAGNLGKLFPCVGIRPVLSESSGEDLTYLIPFENLTARDLAWTALNADPGWTSARSQFRSYQFGLYRSE